MKDVEKLNEDNIQLLKKQLEKSVPPPQKGLDEAGGWAMCSTRKKYKTV